MQPQRGLVSAARLVPSVALAAGHSRLASAAMPPSQGSPRRVYCHHGSQQLSHIDPVSGRPRMVGVGEKPITRRVADAACRLRVSRRLHDLLREGAGSLAKGHVMSTAELAGVMGAKRTAELIPLCHQLPLTCVTVAVTLHPTEPRLDVTCRVECDGRTGVEMEALTGCSVAALTVYDMCKAVDKAIVISGLRLQAKSGGKSGDYSRPASEDGGEDVEGG